MRKMLMLAFMLLIMNQMNPTEAHALSCAEMPSVQEAYDQYDGIVVGRVDKVIFKQESNEVRLAISKSYKGIDQQSLSVEENPTWGALWGPSEVGEEYLFFLQQTDGGWENPLCSPSMKTASASKELGFLKDKEIPIQEAKEPSELSADYSGSAAEPALDGKEDANNWIMIAAVIVGLAGVIAYAIVSTRSNKN
ncbi:hypothetical protein D3C78_1245790 [compost metagenome]